MLDFLYGKDAIAAQDDAGSQRIQILGKQLIMLVYMLMRTVKIHEPENTIFQGPLESFRDIVNEMVDRENACAIEGVGTVVYLNDHLLRFEAAVLDYVEFVIQQLQVRGYNGFKANGKITIDELRALVSLFEKEQKIPDDHPALPKLGRIRMIHYRELRESLKEESRTEIDGTVDIRKKFAVLCYVRTLYFLKKFLDFCRGEGPPVQASRAERLLQNLVDICIKDKHTFLSLVQIKDRHDYTPYHSVNTALLNTALGLELGFSKDLVLELAVSGLYHDLGRVLVPPKVLLKPGALASDDKVEISRIPIHSIKVLLRQRALNKATLERLVAIYEHSVDFAKSMSDPSNFNPASALPQESALSLYGRIIAITHTFESLTSARPWRPSLKPADALKAMFEDMKGKFDPFLLRVFIKALSSVPQEEETGAESPDSAGNVKPGAPPEAQIA
jgi:HD-GYP domain-containing protein (c-di-GMP phosphodiesterase class II)